VLPDMYVRQHDSWLHVKFALCLGLYCFYLSKSGKHTMSGNTIPGCMSISMDHWIFSIL